MDFAQYHITPADVLAVKRAYVREDGCLKSFPNKQKKQVILLHMLSEQLEAEHTYNEKELNEVLKKYYPDYAILRRGLVDFGFLARLQDGSKYWKTGHTL